jgi:signal transduction histidine kinase
VSAVTHELRTPLTTFRMYAGMLADGTIEEEERRQSYLETLRSEASRLSSTVENVLAYARLERGNSPAVRRESVTVKELLGSLSPPLRRRVTEAGMSLRVSTDAADELRVVTDTDAVRQILENLVDNACKYARDAADPSIRIEAAADDDLVRITVRDNGPGVTKDEARSIFSPFDRGRRPVSDDTPGVGLGLAISRGLARDLGGDLRLAPSGERGAAFVLELPS